METIKLRHFIAVCKNNCNLSKAASKLYITQPALSQSISGLEEELGTELFSRVKGRLHLSEKGTIALDIAKAIIAKEDELVSSMGKLDPKLSIFSIEPNLTVVITTGFLLERPDTKFLHDYDTTVLDCDKLIQDDKYDLYITDRPCSDPKYECLFLLNDCEYAYVPKNSRFYGRKAAYLEELDQENFIRPTDSYAATGGLPFRVSTYLSKIIENKNIKIKYMDPGIVQQVFRSGVNDAYNDLYRFLPTLSFYTLYRSGIYLKDRKRLIKLKDPEMTIPYYLVYKKKHSEIVEDFLLWLKNNYNDIFKLPL